MDGVSKIWNGSRDVTTPLSGIICRLCAGTLVLVTIQQCIEFEISTFTHYEDMKGHKNSETGVILALGVTQGHRHIVIR